MADSPTPWLRASRTTKFARHPAGRPGLGQACGSLRVWAGGPPSKSHPSPTIAAGLVAPEEASLAGNHRRSPPVAPSYVRQKLRPADSIASIVSARLSRAGQYELKSWVGFQDSMFHYTQ